MEKKRESFKYLIYVYLRNVNGDYMHEYLCDSSRRAKRNGYVKQYKYIRVSMWCWALLLC